MIRGEICRKKTQMGLRDAMSGVNYHSGLLLGPKHNCYVTNSEYWPTLFSICEKAPYIM